MELNLTFKSLTDGLRPLLNLTLNGCTLNCGLFNLADIQIYPEVKPEVEKPTLNSNINFKRYF